MSDTVVSVLTPSGAGAIATVEVAGPQAWLIARQLFKPAGKQLLPESPELHRFWFGKFADGDEVVLAVKQVEPETVIEVHCHGGRRVLRWVVGQLSGEGGGVSPTCEAPDTSGLRLDARQLIYAPTLRTASILLDQHHGAFERTIRDLLQKFDADQLAALASFAPLGRHLVEPWKVAIAGPPNVGKSSLVNALAGYQRSVVSEVAGTTRDVVTVQVAFDGWPVELADTAGLRNPFSLAGRASDGSDQPSLARPANETGLRDAALEAEGIALAERYLDEADLVIWVLDASDSRQVMDPCLRVGLLVINKIDSPHAWELSSVPDALLVSALTGEGIPGLAAAIARRLVPIAPPPGAAVPYTPQLADLVEAAHRAVTREEAIALIEQADPRG